MVEILDRPPSKEPRQLQLQVLSVDSLTQTRIMDHVVETLLLLNFPDAYLVLRTDLLVLRGVSKCHARSTSDQVKGCLVTVLL